MAKGLTALHCVQALHINGELDDHLQPITVENWNRDITTGESLAAEFTKLMENDSSTIPIEIKVVADALVIEPMLHMFSKMYLYTTRARPKHNEEYSYIEACHGIYK